MQLQYVVSNKKEREKDKSFIASYNGAATINICNHKKKREEDKRVSIASYNCTAIMCSNKKVRRGALEVKLPAYLR